MSRREKEEIVMGVTPGSLTTVKSDTIFFFWGGGAQYNRIKLAENITD